MFDSEFASVYFIEKDNVVFHLWKKEAHFDDYRKPVMAALELIKEHQSIIFVVDARNGFEDTPEDVEWGFEYFLPELKKAGVRYWGFITEKDCAIEGEIDLWTREIKKNFKLRIAQSYSEILRQIWG